MEKERDKIIDEYKYLHKIPKHYFAWEFLRRNKEYQKVFDTITSDRAPYGGFLDAANPRPRPSAVATNLLLNLNRDDHGRVDSRLVPFGLWEPIDYRKKANDQYFLKHHFTEHLDPVILWPVHYGQDAAAWKDYHPTCLNISIDLAASLPDITKYISAIVKLKRKQLSIEDRDVRKHTMDWIEQLIVYDLKKEGLNRQNIAQLLYPKGHHDPYGPNSCFGGCVWCKKIDRQYRRPKKLVETGLWPVFFNR